MDDLAAEAAGPDQWIEEELGGFIIIIAEAFTACQFELFGTKSLVTASTDALGKKMEALWAEVGIFIKYVRKVKALGVGLGAGVRRNVDVMKHRLRMMKKRVPRFRRLRKLGISTSRLLRTGAKAPMTDGQAILGVSNSLLRDQRRTVAVIASPESGSGGQHLDLALTLADESARAGAHPAFDAHIMPIGDWVTSVLESWMPERAMERLTTVAKKKLRKAKNIWAKVKGPAAAMVASSRRLGWTVISSTELQTDHGETGSCPGCEKMEVEKCGSIATAAQKNRKRSWSIDGTHRETPQIQRKQ